MNEYRLYNLNEDFKIAIKSTGAILFEEEFNNLVTHLLYSEDDLSEILDIMNVKYEMRVEEDTDWTNKWKQYLNEGYLTDELYFIFEDKKFDDNRKTILLIPSLAFGTGDHPTTKLAARLATEVAENNTVLDIGTGSGVVAIAMSLYNAKDIIAFDNDPTVIENINLNIRNNSCDNIYPFIGTVDAIREDIKFDIVVANIISSVLLSIKDRVDTLVNKYIIYSGILDSEVDDFLKKVSKHDLKLEKIISIDGWSAIRLKKTNKQINKLSK